MCKWCHSITPAEAAEMTRERRLANLWLRQSDPTAGLIETPIGQARYVAYENQVVAVELRNGRVMEFVADECYLIREG